MPPTVAATPAPAAVPPATNAAPSALFLNSSLSGVTLFAPKVVEIT